jgi:uncharacterized coiled-coil protein SlyX
MAEISKQALKVQNNTEFPNNNAGAITPSKLRTFNVDMIDSLVDEITYNVDSGSWNQQIDALEQFTASASGLNTGSLLLTASAAGNSITFTKGDSSTFSVTVETGSIPDISNLNQATASLQAFTASAQTSINNLNSTTESLNTSVTNINTFTQSAEVSITNLNASSASQQTSIDNLNGATGSYATTGSNTFVGANTFTSISASSFVSASEFIGNGSKITGITASISMPILDEGIPQGNAVSLNFTGSGISAVVVGGTAVVSVNIPDASVLNALTASFEAYTASTDLDLDAIHQATASLEAFTASFSTASLVTTSSFNEYTQSNDQRVTSLEANTASVNTSITELNAITASQQISIDALNVNSESVNTSITNVNSATASLFTSVNNINGFTQSAEISINALNSFTASIDTNFVSETEFGVYTSSNDSKVNALINATASYATTGSNVFVGDQTINGNVNITGSFTASGLIYPTTDGLEKTFVQSDGAGNLSLQYVESLFITVRNSSGLTLPKGTPVYISGSTGDNGNAYVADAADALKMPATSILDEELAPAQTGLAIASGRITGIDTSGYPAGTVVYVAEGGGWSDVRPSGSNSLIQLLGVVQKEGVGGQGLILNQLQTVLPNIETGYAWVGNGNNQPIAVATSSFGSPIDTGSFATTGSNTFDGTQTINADLNVSGSTNVGFINVADAGGINFATTGSGPVTSYGIVTNPSNGDLVINNNPGNGRLITFGQTDARAQIWGGLYLNPIDGGGGVVMTSHSGSMFLTPSGQSSTAESVLHVTSSSPVNNVNLLFKPNNNNTTTIVSGSSNIFTNVAAPTAGFVRYMSGGNISVGGSGTAVPQISSSMAFSPNISNNYFGVSANPLTIRGPISSTAYNVTNNIIGGGSVTFGPGAVQNFERAVSGLAFNNNVVNGAINALAYKTPLSASVTMNNNNFGGGLTLNLDSSSISFTNNTIQGALTINNSYFPSTYSAATGLLAVTSFLNTGNNILFASGSNTTMAGPPRTIQNSTILGTNNVISASLNADNAQINSTTLLGQGLIALGTNSRPLAASAADWGSTFVGRWNSIDGTKDLTAETVFAVGTGTGAATRKTGFLVDSGSNTFVEGTLNVSGATSLNGDLNITGSITASLQEGYVWVGNASGLTTTVATSSFGGGGAAFPYSGTASISGSLQVTGSVSSLPITLSVASSTASIDMTAGNNFILDIPTATTTHIVPTNIIAGQTINLLLRQPATSGSVDWSPIILFPSGLDMVATATGSAIDLVSMISFDTTNLMAANVKNLK